MIEIQITRLPHGQDLPLPAYQSAHAAGMDLIAAVPANAPLTLLPGARALVRTIRANRRVGDGELLVTGQTAHDVDSTDFIVGHTPMAVGFVMGMTYIVLFLLLGSVVLTP